MVRLSNSARAKIWYANNTERACSNVRAYRNRHPEKVKQWRQYRLTRKRAKGECFGCPAPARPNRTKCFKCSLLDRPAIQKLPAIEQEKAMQAAVTFDGHCQCCGSTEHKGQDWHIDHDHITDKFRGILCNHCNAILGFSKEKLEVLDSVKTYITTHAKTK